MNDLFAISDIAFSLGLAALLYLLLMMILSMFSQRTQFWPPPRRESWQYMTLWICIRLLVICIGVVIYYDHSSISISAPVRFYIALPIFILSFMLGSIAALQLGWRNTHGIADGFVRKGFYRYSRNPQYVFYAASFLSLGIVVASIQAVILLVMMAAWYLIAPFPEEKWLEKEYGDNYIAYKNQVGRYLGWG